MAVPSILTPEFTASEKQPDFNAPSQSPPLHDLVFLAQDSDLLVGLNKVEQPAVPTQREATDNDLDKLTANLRPLTSDEAALAAKHYDLVRAVAGKFIRTRDGLDNDDIISDATAGLLDAAEKFDPSQEVQFATFAVIRIRGAIIDGMRHRSFLPRSLVQRIKLVNDLETRQVGDDEICETLKITKAKLHQTRYLAVQGVHASLDSSLGSSPKGDKEAVTLNDLLAAEDSDPAEGLVQSIGETLTAETMKRAISMLNLQEATLIRRYYFEGMSLKEAGKIEGVTESRMCQVHRKAIEKLLKIMQQAINDDFEWIADAPSTKRVAMPPESLPNPVTAQTSKTPKKVSANHENRDPAPKADREKIDYKLTAEEEQELVATMRHRQDILRDQSDALASDLELRRAVIAGEHAQERLVRSLMPWVVYLAKRHAFRNQEVDRQDLEQEGFKGLLRALERFEPERGNRLSTYAGKCINGEMQRYIRDHGAILRIPRNLYEKFPEVTRTREGLHKALEREPTVSEIATAAGMGEDEVITLLTDRSVIPLAVTEEHQEDYYTYIAAEDPKQDAYVEIQGVYELLNLLPEREQYVIRALYLTPGRNIQSGCLTQQEVATALAISQAHVGRIAARALATLRDLANKDNPSAEDAIAGLRFNSHTSKATRI